MIKRVAIKLYYVPSTALSTLYALFYCIFTTTLRSRSHYLHFTKEHLQIRELHSNPSPFDLKSRSLQVFLLKHSQ